MQDAHCPVAQNVLYAQLQILDYPAHSANILLMCD